MRMQVYTKSQIAELVACTVSHSYHAYHVLKQKNTYTIDYRFCRKPRCFLGLGVLDSKSQTNRLQVVNRNTIGLSGTAVEQSDGQGQNPGC